MHACHIWQKRMRLALAAWLSLILKLRGRELQVGREYEAGLVRSVETHPRMLPICSQIADAIRTHILQFTPRCLG